MLAAGVRRSVVGEYEEAAAAAGFAQRELSLVSFAALPRLLRSAPDACVAAVLGDTSLTLSVISASTLLAFRSRLRDAGEGEPARLWDEAERTARLAGLDAFVLAVVGGGASEVVHHLQAAGRPARTGWTDAGGADGAPACEAPWLGLA
jgi:hypothetical protein